MCVKIFGIVKILEQKTRVQIVDLIPSISYSIVRYKNEKNLSLVSHEALVGLTRDAERISGGNVMERDNLADISVDVGIILKWFFKR